LKFLFWTDGFWPRIGGIETQARYFIERMHQKGHLGLVVAQQDDPSWKEDELYKGVPIKRFDFNRIFPTQELYRLRPIETYLEWVRQEFQPDILYLNVCTGWVGFIFLLFKRIFRIPVIITVHSPFFYMNETNPILAKISSQADLICCVSKWVLNETEKLIPTASNKLRLIYNGLPIPDLAATPLCFSSPTLLVIGRLTREKGFEIAIQAFALLKNSAARLLIVGNGEERSRLEQWVDQLGLESSVEFIGALEKSEVPSLINRATLVIVPSYFESFGLVAVEAMQMQRPVIASNVGGLAEIIIHKETGLLVPPRDPLALSLAIRFLLENPETAIEMGIKGHKRAVKSFTLEQNVQQYEALHRELR
jgi:glycogen(starch) synthase